MKFINLVGQDDATTSTKDFDMRRSAIPEQVYHVFEEFHVPALVGADSNSLYILLDCGGDDFIDRTVVSKVHHFYARGLKQATHDVNRNVVAIVKACRCHKADRVAGLVGGYCHDFVSFFCVPAYGSGSKQYLDF